MKKMNNCSIELAALNEKCDLIIELLRSLADNPDFLIERLRSSVEKQMAAEMKSYPSLKICGHDAE